jgi:hypothetical protein
MNKSDSALAPKTDTNKIPELFTSFWRTITWIVFILILSLLPGKAFEKFKLFDISFQDLIVHFCIYAVLTALIIKELSRKNKQNLTTNVWWLVPVLASTVLGIFTEMVQWLWIPGRSGNIVDFLLNMTGSAMVILLYRIIKLKVR